MTVLICFSAEPSLRRLVTAVFAQDFMSEWLLGKRSIVDDAVQSGKKLHRCQRHALKMVAVHQVKCTGNRWPKC